MNLRIEEHRKLCVESLNLLQKIANSKMSYEQLLYRIQIEDQKPEVIRYLASSRREFVECKDDAFRRMQSHIKDYNKIIKSWPQI